MRTYLEKISLDLAEENEIEMGCDTKSNIRMNFGHGGGIHRLTEGILLPCKLNQINADP
jgi:hypothetical protein